MRKARGISPASRTGKCKSAESAEQIFNKGQQLPTIDQQLLFLFIDIFYSKQSAGEGGCFAESHKQSLVDLSLGVNEDAAKEQYQTSYREDKGCDEL